MAYFVTGATGFIGRFLVANLLKRGQPIYALVRKGSQKKLATLREELAARRELADEVEEFAIVGVAAGAGPYGRDTTSTDTTLV